VIPQIYDTFHRVIRTVIQTIPGVIALAALYPLVVDAIGLPKDSNVGLWLAGSVTVVAGIAAALTRVMAIPAVNTFLAKIRLDGHSGEVIPGDTYTSMIAVQRPADTAGEYDDEAAH
jgi:hypothetical protein